MYRQRSVLGVIPARGGSKGLPRKNVLPLAGRPLIAWTIEQAKASRHLDRCVVTTEDEEIAAIARRWGGDVPFLRPRELGGDATPTIEVLRHVLGALGTSYDYIALLEPTSPLRRKDDIDHAIEQLVDREQEADSLVSLGAVHLEHPCILKRLSGGYVVPYLEAPLKVTRRQELEEALFPYGVIYLSKREALLRTGTFYQERTLPYPIERWQNYEVDDAHDLACIEAVLKQVSGT